MNPPPTQTSSPGQATPEAKRFTYAGGSRPLDGFTIKRGVGHGGFGEVYYATSDGGKEVALKLIRRSLDVELRGIRQCLNLKHPNLLGVFDIREDDRGDYWVVMEYVAGDCLDDVIARHPEGMLVQEALGWLSGIAAGVGYLHDHGIVHRDLKPANIFAEEGRVSIGDYGLSKFISCSRRSGHTESVGTVHYMAPEVANGRYGKEIDVYALGIILYEMLTGRLPFEGESVGEVLMKHLTAKPDVSMLEEPYRGVVARALEKDPEKRFSSVEEMVAELPIQRSADLLPQAKKTQIGSGANGSAKSQPAQAAGQVDTPAAIVAEAVDEEPILGELRQICVDVQNWWHSLNDGIQVTLIVIVGVGVVFAKELTIPVLLSMVAVYVLCRVVRAIRRARKPSSAQSPAVAQASSPPAADSPLEPGPGRQAAHARRKHYRRFRPYEKPTRALIVKPFRERLVELLGSMLLSALVAAIMTLVVVIVVASASGEFHPGFPAYLLLVSIAGSWAVMVPCKFWEGTQGDAMVRRFVMMTVGLVLGAFAWGCFELVTISPAFTVRHEPTQSEALLMHVVAFGALMLLVRWWRQADPLRPARLSLWCVLASMFLPALLILTGEPPTIVLTIVAGIMSISVQIASPWVNPRLRQASPED